MKEDKVQYYNIHTHRFDALCQMMVLNLMYNKTPELKSGGFIKFSAGIHPWYLNDIELQMHFLTGCLSQSKVIAIGECGLDKYSGYPKEVQQEVFFKQAKLSEKYQKPMIVHCVRTYYDLIDLHRMIKPEMPWILHGFYANMEITEACIREGFYFSLGKRLMHNNIKVSDMVDRIPVTRLFFETDDADFSVTSVYSQYTEIKGIPLEDLCNQIDKNFRSIFKEY